MNKYINKIVLWIRKFMQGRYGADDLFIFSVRLYLILVVLGLFIPTLSLITPIFLVFIFYRLLSKDISKRREENVKFLRYKSSAKKQLLQLKNRWKERDTHRYRKCPSCKTTLRLKKQIGTVNITCPVCKNNFSVNIKH
ncbi:MAG: hypothetical protein GX337_09310 [Christensenellaceae bacterium]|nr:hypothetical protein [Christensenellaceae bacterium]